MAITDVQFTDERWLQFWQHYKGLEHQKQALRKLARQIKQSDPGLLTESAEWVADWQQSDVANTWNGIEVAARFYGSRYPELVAAQWRLESGSGKHMSGRNNPFGLKGTGTVKTTQEVVNGKAITIDDSFINFDSIDEAVRYLVERWYLDWKQHKGVNHAPNRNEAARELQRQGYATLPSYAERLIKLMDQVKPLKPTEQVAARPVSFGNPLQVPWYAQMDSADRSQAARMCFSSSCAMLLQYLKPGTLKGPNGDDQYLKRVQQYGDTTDAAAQIRALSSFGIKAQFVQNADFGLIERQVAAGVPVPCGFIHRGPVDRPTGGGHWLIVVGHDPTYLVVHDPFGEADLVSGRTLGGVARFMRYSRQNFGKRWMVEPAGGTYRYAPGKGWAIIATDG